MEVFSNKLRIHYVGHLKEITDTPKKSEAIIASLRSNGIACTVIGKVVADSSQRIVKRIDGRVEILTAVAQDPFWPAFFRSLASRESG